MKPLVLFLSALSVLPLAAHAAPRNVDPDWPCQQALVPKIAAATLWSGPPLDNIGDWHATPTVAGAGRAYRAAQRLGSRWRGRHRRVYPGLGGDRNRLITLAFAGFSTRPTGSARK